MLIMTYAADPRVDAYIDALPRWASLGGVGVEAVEGIAASLRRLVVLGRKRLGDAGGQRGAHVRVVGVPAGGDGAPGQLAVVDASLEAAQGMGGGAAAGVVL